MTFLRAPSTPEPDGPGRAMDALVTWPPAKVNLHLAVGERRPDGFHDLVTVFQAIDLVDRLSVAVAGEGVELRVDGADVGPTEQNLCVRAARAFVRETGGPSGVRMHLLKGIPAGAGLGGGSSDAAFVLRSLNALAHRPLPKGRLAELGAALGSDVPFFLGSSALAVGRGRGDRLEPLDPLPAAALVVVTPPVHVDTGEAYRALDARREASGEPPTGPVLEGGPSSWSDVARLARNDFQDVVAAQHAPVADAIAALRERGARPTLLSGSGAAVFGVLETWAQAVRAAREITEALGCRAVAARTLPGFGAVSPLSRPNSSDRAG